MEPHTPSFQTHIDRIRSARQQADATCEPTRHTKNAAEASIAILWEVIFDLLCGVSAKAVSTRELNILSSIVGRLMGSYHQMKVMDIKIRESSVEGAMEADANESGISNDTLERIEKALSLL